MNQTDKVFPVPMVCMRQEEASAYVELLRAAEQVLSAADTAKNLEDIKRLDSALSRQRTAVNIITATTGGQGAPPV